MTPQPDRVAEELRALSSLEAGWYANVGAKTGQRCCAAMREAADLLTTQAREIAELRGALEEARDQQLRNGRAAIRHLKRAEALQSKLDEAVGALKPFAALGAILNGKEKDEAVFVGQVLRVAGEPDKHHPITFGDLRLARSCLSRLQGEGLGRLPPDLRNAPGQAGSGSEPPTPQASRALEDADPRDFGEDDSWVHDSDMESR